MQTALNDVIADAVEEVQDDDIHLIQTNYTGSPFEGMHLCNGGVSDFNGASLPLEYSFHPNENGQEDYAGVIADALNP